MRLFLHLCLAVIFITCGFWLAGVWDGLDFGNRLEPAVWHGTQWLNEGQGWFNEGVGVMATASVIATLVVIGIFVIFGMIALMVLIPVAILVALLMCGFSIGWPLVMMAVILWLLWPTSKPSY